uniref:Uncharacterized protein n=1 Tax=Romanomermis culicivorax TaxID=13658 RepID=A0A915L450_ROMCU
MVKNGIFELITTKSFNWCNLTRFRCFVHSLVKPRMSPMKKKIQIKREEKTSERDDGGRGRKKRLRNIHNELPLFVVQQKLKIKI